MSDYKFELNKESPVYSQIYLYIKKQIINGELPHGAKILPERQLAEKLGVHRNTIVKAYNELKADDLIVSKQGQGYFVNYGSIENKKTSGNRKKKLYWPNIIGENLYHLDKSFNSFITQSYRDGASISFTQSTLPPEYYNQAELKQLICNIVEKEDIFGVTPYQGRRDLRKCLSLFLKERGILVNASDIVVLSDESTAIGCIMDLVLKPGDTVIMEEPYSPLRYKQIESLGIQIQTIPIDQNGMKTQLLEPLILKYRPKMILTSGSFNEPSGYAKSLERKKQLLDLSHQYEIPILEENWASDLSFVDSCASLISMDQGGNTVYVHSFGLTCAPGMRCALITGPSDLIKAICKLLPWKDIKADNLAQALLCEYIKSGLYKKTILSAVVLNKKKCELVRSKLELLKDYGVVVNNPAGGICVWCRLPDKVDMEKLLSLCLKTGVSIFAGDAFFYNGIAPEKYIKINYVFPTMEELDLGLDHLVTILLKLLVE